MRYYLYIVISVLWLPLLAKEQHISYIDSVNNKLTMPMADTAKVNLLNKIAYDLVFIDHDKILEYAYLALELSEEINYSEGIANAFNNMGIYYREKGIYNEAIDYFFNALKIMEKENNDKGIARSNNLIGILYYYLGNYDLSLEYYLKALKINQDQHDMKWIAGNSNNIGMIYERTGKYEQALNYYMKSLEMNISLGNKNWISNNYGNIGSLYLLMDKPQSLEYFMRKLEISMEQGNQIGISRAYNLIGSYYIKYGDFKKAIPYLSTGFAFAKSTNSLSNLKLISEMLSTAYDSLSIYDSAYYYQRKYKTYDDSLNLNENTQKITRLRLQYQHNKNTQIRDLNYQKAKFRQTLTAIALIFILVVFILLYSHKRSIARQQKIAHEQLEMENRALQEELMFKEKLLQENIKYLLNKNEIISALIEDLKQIRANCEKENVKSIDEIIRDIKVGTDDDTWNEFELHFNQIHSDFYKKLQIKYPSLTGNEKKLCAFIKLNMSTKEISSLTQHSIKSIETARTRLRKKLIPTESSMTLSELFDQF